MKVYDQFAYKYKYFLVIESSFQGEIHSFLLVPIIVSIFYQKILIHLLLFDQSVSLQKRFTKKPM